MGEYRRYDDDLRAARATRFAAKLAELLHDLGLTHKALGDQLGVTRHAVDSWTRGADSTTPEMATFARLCTLLETYRPGSGRDLATAAGRAWQPGDALPGSPPATGLPAVPTNLPAPLTSFVGRGPELTYLQQLLAGTRLLTLTGAGGIGKTRLALQAAPTLAARVPQGIWLVELAPLQDPAAVPGAVAMALGVREQGATPLPATLADYLQRRQVLLILDNCEHLVEAVAGLVHHLLAAAPDLRVLATSREALRLPGEVVWRVPALSAPAPTGPASDAPLESYEATRLFLDRARQADPLFEVRDPADADAVRQICRQLDGVPLAVELAAACARVLAVGEIAARLDDRFRLLTDGSRAALPRHQTLHAAISWSYDLLAEAERALFVYLAVFAGGWTLDAAEAISSESIPAGEILAGLKQLADKSLIVVEAGDGATRYRMLETIRAYGLEQLLVRGEEAAVRAAHGRYYLALAEAASAQMHGPDQPDWLERLERDHDNLRATLRWAADSGETDIALRLGRALTLFWFFHGHFSEGRHWLGTLCRLDVPDDTPLLPWMLNGAGVLACFQGDFAYARDCFAESIRLAEGLGDGESVAFALTCQGGAALYAQDFVTAAHLAGEGLARFRTFDNPWNTGLALNNLIPALLGLDQMDRARQLAEERLRLYADLSNPWGIATSYVSLGLVAAARGNAVQAAVFYRSAITHFLSFGDRWGCYEALAGLAAALAVQYQNAEAARIVAIAAMLRDALGAMAPRPTTTTPPSWPRSNPSSAQPSGTASRPRSIPSPSIPLWPRLLRTDQPLSMRSLKTRG